MNERRISTGILSQRDRSWIYYCSASAILLVVGVFPLLGAGGGFLLDGWFALFGVHVGSGAADVMWFLSVAIWVLWAPAVFFAAVGIKALFPQISSGRFWLVYLLALALWSLTLCLLSLPVIRRAEGRKQIPVIVDTSPRR